MVNRLLFLFVLLEMVPLAASAQGVYLRRGQSGLWVSGEFSTNREETGLGASAGVSMSGLVDLGVDFMRLRPKDDASDDLAAYRLSPKVTVYPIKQDRRTPFTLGIYAAYDRITFDDDDLDAEGEGFTIGTFVQGLMIASPSSKFSPHAGISYSSIEYEGAVRPPRESGDSIVFPLGLAVVVYLPGGSTFVLDPTLVVGDEPPTFGVKMGFVMGFH